MGIYTIHEDAVTAEELPGRKHKMVVKPNDMGTKNVCAGTVVYPGNTRIPPHAHEKEEGVLYVLEGEGNIYFNGKPEQIRKGTFMVIPKGVEHFIETTTDSGLKFIYVFTPPVIRKINNK